MKISRKISVLLIIIGIQHHLAAMQQHVGYYKTSSGYYYYKATITSKPVRVPQAVYLKALSLQQQYPQAELLAPKDIKVVLGADNIINNNMSSTINLHKRDRSPSPTPNDPNQSSSIPPLQPAKKLKPNDDSTSTASSSSSTTTTTIASTTTPVTPTAPLQIDRQQVHLHPINNQQKDKKTNNLLFSISDRNLIIAFEEFYHPKTSILSSASTTSSSIDDRVKRESLESFFQSAPLPLIRYISILYAAQYGNNDAFLSVTTNDEKVKFFDNDNLTITTFKTQHSKNFRIYQLPVLCQCFLCLQELYGNDYDLLCGHYALHFAKVLANNAQATLAQLAGPLNDRTSFENNTYYNNLVTLTESHNKSAFISGDAIGQLLDQHMRPYTYIQNTMTYDMLLIYNQITKGIDQETDNEINHIDSLITQFKQNKIPYVVFILNPGFNHGIHWITVLARKNTQQQVELIICDSRGSDHRNDPTIEFLYIQLGGVE